MSSPPRNRKNLMPWGLCALIVLAGLAAYGNSLTGSFIFDDEYFIVDNDVIRSPWPIRPLVADTSWESRLVVMLSLALNYAIGGLDVFGYHLVNLAIHLMAGLTLFGLLRRTLKLVPQYSAEPIAADFLAVAVALIWLVHPLQTQSVTYVIQRTESLMGLFYLVCLYCVLRGSQASRSWPWYVAAVAACWLGMGTKQVMVTAPVVVLLYDRTFLAGSWKEVLRRRWALYLGFVPALVWLCVVTVRAASRAVPASAGFSMEGITKLDYLGTQGGVILHYLRLAFWPDRLCLDYRWPMADSARAIFLPGAVVAALLVASLITIRYRPRLGFLGLSFFLILAPTSSIMPIIDMAAERRMYLPLVALVVLVVFTCDVLARRFVRDPRFRTVLEAGALVIVVVPLALRTIDRNGDYQDPVAMWKDVLATAPHNARAHLNLGYVRIRQGNIDDAITDYTHAIRLNPDFSKAYYNRGVAYGSQGDKDQAITDYTHAIRLNPDYADAYYNRGIAYRSQGDNNQAIIDYTHAIHVNPDYADAYYNRGIAYNSKGDYDQAITDYTHAIRLNPDWAKAYNNRGVAYRSQGDYDQAIVDYTHTIRLNGENAYAYNNRGYAYGSQGDYDQAITDYTHAIRLNPDLAEAYYNRGVAYGSQGDKDQAITDYTQAIRLNGENAYAYNNRGYAYGFKGDYDQAITDYTHAIRLKPDYAEAYNHRGIAYGSKGDIDQAIAEFTHAIRLDPDLAKAYNNRGVVYSSQGDYDQAITDYTHAIRLKPDLAGAYYNRGIAHEKKGSLDKAAADYAKAKQLRR